MLTLHSITKHFGATIALDGVDLDVAPGEVHALIGENGAGKSTLMNILSGAFPPDSGAMVVGGQSYAPRGPADARARGIAHIHQELALCAHLPVAENILMGIEPSRGGWLRRDELLDRAAALLADFGRAEIDPRVRTGDLPLADQQVVEICRALASDARVLLMDEPTSSLQRANVERLFDTVRRLRDRGIAVIYISHFLEEVREIATRCTVLRDGRSVGTGELVAVTDDELISLMVGRAQTRVSVPHSSVAEPRSLPEPHAAQTRVSVPHSSLAEPRSAAKPSAESNVAQTLLSVPEPGSLSSPTPDPRRPTPEVLLLVENLSAPPRLRAASFSLRRGEVLGIAGLIGSGRTDLIRALFGLQKATGRVAVHGNGFGYLSEDRKGEGLALQLPIADNVTMSRFDTCAHGGWIDRGLQDTQTESVMQRLRIKAPGPRGIVGRLSGGNQQKVALGRLLHQDPDILLLDEPARGIDIGSKSDIYREIARLASEGKGIVMVSSYLPELFEVCHSIAVMTRGRLSPVRPVSEWTPDSILETAIGGDKPA
ncbi:MAG TPA: sugar ABC transporter ATP-binding protein [Thermoanaerobaculia bacterium]|jgi:ribose transport system ATP-binding protein|nr:sugar ABC transporter ATP-binding protein [Thermoanaerobaculia bacterium]